MKKVLYILNDCMRKFSYERVAGLMQSLNKLDEPADLYVIRSDAYSGFAAEHNLGEYNIYRLPDYNDYDGILLDINNVFNSAEGTFDAAGVQYVFDAAAAAGKPTISMANRLRGFHYAGIDNYASMTSVIRHLHRGLGLTDFWFANGPADNYENQERVRALRDYCMANSLFCGEERFFSESFIVECGIHAFAYFMEKNHGTLPQAVICANDHIALGIIHAAEEKGYSVPRDFLVTGFDNTDLAATLSPTLTSVDQQRWNMGKACIDTLNRLWRGEQIPSFITTPTKLVLRESTREAGVGASSAEQKDPGNYVGGSASVTDFSYKLRIMQYKLPGCRSIEEICEALIECISVLNCEGVDMVLDRRLFNPELSIGFKEQIGQMRNVSDSMPVEGYPDSLELFFSWRAGQTPEFPRRPVGGRLVHLEPEGSDAGGKNYLFSPLHFMEHTVGYLCLHNCLDLMRIKGVSPVVSTLTMALRNYFTRQDLAYVNHVLSGISMKDGLTGLYNRLGYHEYAYDLFHQTNASGGRLAILFIDMDHLKELNDRYGHAAGDLAIRGIASAILHSVPANAVPVRYGGDEFLILLPVRESAEADSVLKDICRTLPAESRILGIPTEVSFSAGYVLTEPESNKQLDKYVQEADVLMYKRKKEKKAQR